MQILQGVKNRAAGTGAGAVPLCGRLCRRLCGRLCGGLCGGLVLFLCLWPLPVFSGPIIIKLQTPPVHVSDGDTFEADLNHNGRLDFPRERIRLLYVDTPELSPSHKGLDQRFGLPARSFLLTALKARPLTLRIDQKRPRDNYGRTLVVLYAGKDAAGKDAAGKDAAGNINLRLIRRGHSYFDTRFSFPQAYRLYTQAEAKAFEEHLGIWSSAASRRAYLARLGKEGKTPQAKNNPRFVPGLHLAAPGHVSRYKGRFLRMQGRLLKRRFLRKGAWLLFFANSNNKTVLQVFVPRRTGRKLPVKTWPLGAQIEMDGFAQSYQGRPQLRLHHGRAQPDSH